MREHKYRIWDKGRKEWLHDTEHAVNLFGETIIMGVLLQRRDDSFVKMSELNNLIPMEFTGLKDKNGKEIFEGDVVKFTYDLVNLRGIIEYGFGRFYIDSKIHYPICGIDINNKEIIGNICENPKLLKEK